MTIETLEALLAAERPHEALALLDSGELTSPTARLRLLEARAAVATGDLTRASALLARGLEVPDLKEGENSLDALWHAVHPTEPVPHHYDFRMHHQAVERDSAHRRGDVRTASGRQADHQSPSR